MRAAVMRNRQIVVDTLPDPEPGRGEVLVKTLACGICGSDLHVLRHADRFVNANRQTGSVFVMDPRRDVVMGHEFCAEVLDHGPGAQKTLKPGTRVCSMPLAITANGIRAIGYSNDFPGGYGEKMVLNEGLLLEVPAGLSTEHAALTEPMAVGFHAVEKAALAGEEVPLVVGCGPVGLAVIAALKLRGVGPVVAADFSAARRVLAEKMGADILADPAEMSPYECWRDVAAPEGFDPSNPMMLLGLGPQLPPCVIFECVGVPGVIGQIMEGAPRNARAVIVGVCMERDQIEPVIGINKELSIQFALGYTPEEFAGTFRNIAEGRIDVEPLITGKVGLGGVGRAFEDLATPDRHAKILVEPWRD